MPKQLEPVQIAFIIFILFVGVGAISQNGVFYYIGFFIAFGYFMWAYGLLQKIILFTCDSILNFNGNRHTLFFILLMVLPVSLCLIFILGIFFIVPNWMVSNFVTVTIILFVLFFGGAVASFYFLLPHYNSKIQQKEEQKPNQNIITYYQPSSRIYKSSSDNKFTLKDIDKMSGREFEEFLQKLFEKMGYSVELTAHTNDYGADLILSKSGERISVQAKNWGANVGNSAVQEVVSSLKYYNTQRGIVVSSSDFSNNAIKLAHHNHVELWNRDKLDDMLKKYLIIK